MPKPVSSSPMLVRCSAICNTCVVNTVVERCVIRSWSHHAVRGLGEKNVLWASGPGSSLQWEPGMQLLVSSWVASSLATSLWAHTACLGTWYLSGARTCTGHTVEAPSRWAVRPAEMTQGNQWETSDCWWVTNYQLVGPQSPVAGGIPCLMKRGGHPNPDGLAVTKSCLYQCLSPLGQQFWQVIWHTLLSKMMEDSVPVEKPLQQAIRG